MLIIFVISIWIRGLEDSFLIRDVHYNTVCADVYHLAAHASGVPSHMLTLRTTSEFLDARISSIATFNQATFPMVSIYIVVSKG